jgi:hypothetical protein
MGDEVVNVRETIERNHERRNLCCDAAESHFRAERANVNCLSRCGDARIFASDVNLLVG